MYECVRLFFLGECEREDGQRTSQIDLPLLEEVIGVEFEMAAEDADVGFAELAAAGHDRLSEFPGKIVLAAVENAQNENSLFDVAKNYHPALI